MSTKLLGNGDLIVLRETASRGIWIAPHELRSVIGLVGEVAYALYTYYRTFPFIEDSELHDDLIAKAIGWSARKVGKYRRILEGADLLLRVRYGTEADGVTKLFVGEDTIALFNAGLPADIINPKALSKLKKELNILTSAELIKDAALVVTAYETNPAKYN